MTSIISRDPKRFAQDSKPSRPARRSKRKSIFTKKAAIPSAEIRAAQIALCAEIDQAFAGCAAEVDPDAASYPSDYRDPQWSAVYFEMEILLDAIYGDT